MYFSICFHNDILVIWDLAIQPTVVSMTFPQYPTRSGSPAASGAIGMSMQQQTLGRLKGGEISGMTFGYEFLQLVKALRGMSIWYVAKILVFIVRSDNYKSPQKIRALRSLFRKLPYSRREVFSEAFTYESVEGWEDTQYSNNQWFNAIVLAGM